MQNLQVLQKRFMLHGQIQPRYFLKQDVSLKVSTNIDNPTIFDYGRERCNILVCISWCIYVCCHFSWVHTYKWNCWVIACVQLETQQKILNCFSSICTSFHSHQQCKSQHCPAHSSKLCISVLKFSHSGWRVVFSHCGFNLYSPVTGDVKGISSCLLTIWVPSL